MDFFVLHFYLRVAITDRFLDFVFDINLPAMVHMKIV